MVGKILYDKLWDDYLVMQCDDGFVLIYIDCQLLYEVIFLQVFEGLCFVGRKFWCIDVNIVMFDYNVLIIDCDKGIDGIVDLVLCIQVEMLDKNCDEFGIFEFKIKDQCQGIVYVIGLEQGVMLLGMIIVCGDFYIFIYGVFGCFVYGIGMFEVEYVLVIQCLVQQKMKNMLVKVNGKLGLGVIGKDVVFVIIGKIGMVGGIGYVIEFGGEVIWDLSMEVCMIICNMLIEVGVWVGMVVVDDIIIDYVCGCLFVFQGEQWDVVEVYWCMLYSDDDVVFDKVVELDGVVIQLQVSWGILLEMVVGVDGFVLDLVKEQDLIKCEGIVCVFKYMGLELNILIIGINLDCVFIGFCINS